MEAIESGEPTGMCNGDVATIRAYFRRLDLHLRNSTEPVPIEFYTDVVTLIENGQTLRFPTMENGAASRPDARER